MSEPNSSGGRETLPVVEILGTRVHNIVLSDVLDTVDEVLEQGLGGFVTTPNADHYYRLHSDARFREVYQRALLILADGMPVLWAARLLGTPLRAKLSGSDLVYWLSEHAAKKGYPVYLFGGEEGIAETAGERLAEMYPGFEVAGCASPPFGFHEFPDQCRSAVAAIEESGARICFVALGAPKQEFFCADYTDPNRPIVYACIGAGLDFVAGTRKRAPRLMQRAGLEWLWRLIEEPGRLWRRYLLEDPLFFYLVYRQLRGTYRPSDEPRP